MEEKYNQIISFLKKYLEQSKAFGYVIGISGGKDSTVVAKLLVDAVGKKKVLGILMPNGEQEDISDSFKVCELLDIDYQIVNIKDSYNKILYQIMADNHPNFPGDINYKATTEKTLSTYYVTKKAESNIAPRLRMTTLYAIAQSLGYLVCGTGNKSERFIGWFTKWGDYACDINPIAHLTCTEVIELGDYLNLPYDLVHKVPADGLTGKSDEENIGLSYEIIDHMITEGWYPFELPVETAKKFNKLHKSSLHKFSPITLCENE